MEVSTSRCICLPLKKKKSLHADIFGRKRKVWMFSCYRFSCSAFFSARGYPLSPAQKYGCLVVFSGSVHVQLYLPSVVEKNLRTRIFSVASEKYGCSVVIDSVLLQDTSEKVWMSSCYRFIVPCTYRSLVRSESFLVTLSCDSLRARKGLLASGSFVLIHRCDR